MVKIKTATYLPRFLVGASSAVAARAVSSPIPAPTPASAMPPIFESKNIVFFNFRSKKEDHVQMKTFMVLAVLAITIAIQMKVAPMRATYRRPIKSERDPTKGQTPARARRLARTFRTSQQLVSTVLVRPETYKPNPSVDTTNITVDIWRNAA